LFSGTYLRTEFSRVVATRLLLGQKAMTKKTAKKTFRMNGWIYEYNQTMTSNWGWPEGCKGERVRILKKQMQQLLKERDYFRMAYTEI